MSDEIYFTVTSSGFQDLGGARYAYTLTEIDVTEAGTVTVISGDGVDRPIVTVERTPRQR